MFDKNKLTSDARAYFDSLPAILQENLIMTGTDLSTKEDLENFFTHMYNGS